MQLPPGSHHLGRFSILLVMAKYPLVSQIRIEGPDMLTANTRELFPLASDLTYLNHGGFGATPKSVLEEKKRILDEIEKNPVDFLAHRIKAAWHQVTDKIAGRFTLEPASLAIVDNATDGIEAVLRAQCLKEGDEILTTSMTYGAVAMAAQHIAEKQRARTTLAELRFPDPDPQQCIDAVARAITTGRSLQSSITSHRPRPFSCRSRK
ncbi:MAG: aminotransferase class V-fold PLP-dependent enzyme [Deltaproteobacteria bacterium]|nr:aminotransferase class V-fold PLP-dependent enzyme [Deltaproteobacteria bacterium]